MQSSSSNNNNANKSNNNNNNNNSNNVILNSNTVVATGNQPMTNTGIQHLLTGCPIAHNRNSLTAGPLGPVLISDRVLLEKVTQFDREKTPPRNVHALGYGHYGSFTLTNPEASKYSSALIFNQEIGASTEVLVRFSGVFTELGEPDTLRDLRGFACKFYTPEGNWDILATNTPAFNVRDMKNGPDAVHAFKRDPRSFMWNPNTVWDFVATHPEGLQTTLMIYTDRVGTPASMRYQNYFACNTFSFTNAKNERFWVRYHIISQQGWKGLSQEQAAAIAGEDPDYLKRDVWRAIENGNFPKWKLCVQVMPEREGYEKPWAFDCTKVWKHADYPLIELGVIELNRNPVNFFAEIEQVAFSPANVVPGIGFSPDRLLQGRLLVYDDTQHHRLGPNFKQYPPNAPRAAINTDNPYIGGHGQLDTRNKFPHYHPSLFGGLQPKTELVEPPIMCPTGEPGFYDPPGYGTDDDFYAQPREFLETLAPDELTTLVQNLAVSFSRIENRVLDAMMFHLSKINSTFASLVSQALGDRANGLRLTKAEVLMSQLASELDQPQGESILAGHGPEVKDI